MVHDFCWMKKDRRMDFRMVVLAQRTLSSFGLWLLPSDVLEFSSLEEDKALAVYM
jgi:hypothetical protein